MKKIYLFSLSVVLTAAFTSTVFAGFVDNNTNFSAEYTRMNARTGSADSLDTVVYNPAGTVKLKDGLYTALNNQMLPKEYKHKINANGKEYSTTTLTAVLPSMFMLYKQNDWSAYFAVTVPGGGGVLEYDDGLAIPGADGLKSELKSIYYAMTIGGAYAINDMFSVSAGCRVIYGVLNAKIADGAGLDYESSAAGAAAILGLNISPLAGLNIGIVYEMETDLDWEADKNATNNAMFPAKGDVYEKDLPATISIGASYMLLPELKLAADFQLALNQFADWDTVTAKGTNSMDPNDTDTGFSFRVGAEYTVIPMLKLSLSSEYTKTGGNDRQNSFLSPKLDYVNIAGGFQVEPLKDLLINVGVTKAIYLEEETSSLTLNKDLWIIGLGAQYKIF